MDAFYLHAAVAAGWFATQGLVLLNVPNVVTFLLLVPESRAATDLETYLCRALALALIALAFLTLVLASSPSLPSSSSSSSGSSSSGEAKESSPTVIFSPSPVLGFIVAFNISSAILAYAYYLSTGRAGFAVGAAGYGAVAGLGGWAVLFGGEARRVSKRTGKDKRTSGWPFGRGLKRGVMLRKGEAKEEIELKEL